MQINKKVAIIGHFGADESILDGQTIKTCILYNELKEATDWRIQKVDTYYRKKNSARLIMDSLKALCSVKDIIVLLSVNGMRIYFPVLFIAAKLFHTNVYHDVIGSNLADYVKRYPSFRRYLNAFRVNWVETEKIKTQLEQVDVHNAEVLPNFKRLNIIHETQINTSHTKPYRFCTFSRVMKEKGIETAIEAIEEINKQYKEPVCTLDIYGKIDSQYEARFSNILKNTTAAVRYCGEISFDKSVEAISGYYAMLFPTYWVGEGFAGSFIDAFSAGLPVIATDWNCNAELIQSGVNGILYPNDKFVTLADAIIWAIENPEEILNMKYACIKSAHCYKPEKLIPQIVNKINLG